MPFPFLYAPLSILIACYSCVILVYPIFASVRFQDIWCINLIATQMGDPFSNDVNDIPLMNFLIVPLISVQRCTCHKVMFAAAAQRRRKLEGAAAEENWRKTTIFCGFRLPTKWIWLL